MSDEITSYVDEYELRVDEGDYTPTERERLLIEDAMRGYEWELQRERDKYFNQREIFRRERDEALKKLHSILYEVRNKVPGETRIETARRIIRQHETPSNNIAVSEVESDE